ncbi:hypothetical protein BKA83DRAFT_231850 [Pisolithus microcarpus]|nr:hypothetical protein BKA83DRAFT_231850 [Pisolithus microcarpus]
MYSETSTLPFSLGHAPLSRSTIRHSQGVTRHGGCQLEHGHHTAASVDTRDSQYLKLLSLGGRDVSTSEVLQLSSRPNTSTPQAVACSSDVALSLEYVVDQHRPPSIDPRLVDRTRDSQVTQGNAFDYIMNNGTPLPPSYTSPRLPHAAEWSSGYPRESEDTPTSGDLDNSFAACMMGPIPSPHDYTAGQGAGPYEPWPRLPASAAPPPQKPHPSDGFAIGNVPLPPKQGQAFFNTPHPTNPLNALQYIHGRQRQSLTRIPPQSNSMSYSTRCPIPSHHDYTAGRMTGSNAPWPRLPNSAALPPREPHLSDDFAVGNVPPPPKEGPFFNTPRPTNSLHALQHIPEHQSLSRIPSQSNSMSYSASHSHGYNRSYPPFPMPNQNSPSRFLQEHLRYPSSVQPHYARPVDPPGFHGGIGGLGGRYEGDSHIELSHHGTIQYTRQMYMWHRSRLVQQGVTPSYSNGLDTESKVHGDRPSRTLSDHETHSFHNYAAYVPGEHTTGGAVDDYGNFDESKVNSERVVGLPPRLPLPPNQLPLSPRKCHSHDRLSPIAARRTSRHARRSATDAQSRSSTKPRKVCYRNAPTPCGWRDDTGSECGELVNCGNLKDHFATAHPIKKTAEDVKIICRWCRSQRAVMRKNFPRHLKEVHLGSARSKKENSAFGLCARTNDG